MYSAIFKTFFLSLCIIANTHLAMAQTASILPPAKTQYLDNSGKPLTSGKVFNYIPSTTTFKTTWQDAAETIPNTNPVILDAGGRAKILGDGSYRQIVKDRLDNIIWDAVTSSSGSGGGGSTATGDGDLVGTIKPWAGMTAPNQYAFTYGQEVSRTTYAALFTAITSSQATFCTSASPILTGLTDTTNFWIGMSVEVSCLAAGFSTVISKTASTVTLAANANVTVNTTAIFYPWGRGNGTTTFNLPDYRGFAIAGNNNMGGVASSILTTTYFGATNPNSSGAAGGGQSQVLLAANLPTHTHTSSTLNDPGHIHTIDVGSSGGGTQSVTQGVDPPGATVTGPVNTNTTGITLSASTGTNASGVSTAFSIIQPTKTSNYIIKITPDANSATASGVTSLGGMTGDIACGAGLTCTGNIISAPATSLIVGSTPISAGTTTAPLFNNAGILGNGLITSTWSTFLQIGTNAVTRTVQAKLAERISVADFATITDAVNAIKANAGGTLDFGCGDYSLPTGAKGIDFDDINYPVRITGNAGSKAFNSCLIVRYTGTGTAISARQASGSFEMDHIYLYTPTAAIGVDTGPSVAVPTLGAIWPYIHDNIIGMQHVASSIGIRINRNQGPVVSRNFIDADIGISGAMAAGDFVIDAQIDANRFAAGGSISIRGAANGANIKDNISELPTEAFVKYGLAGACFTMNVIGNWIGDFSPGVPTTDAMIRSDCGILNSKGNTYANAVGGTNIKQDNSTGKVISDGDDHEATTAVNIGTGNSVQVPIARTVNLTGSLVSGTPVKAIANDVYFSLGNANGLTLDLGTTGTNGSILFRGSTSGSGTLSAEAVMGGPWAWKLPQQNGTIVASASSPLSVHVASGNMSCPTCVTSSGGGAITGTSPISVSAAGVVSITSPLPIANGGTGTTAGAVVAVKKQSFCPSGCTTTVASGASGTYTPSTGMLYAVVETCSSGGGGGGVVGAASKQFIGGGGGAGGFTRHVLTAAAVGASKLVLIGSLGTGGAAGANAGTAGGDTCITTSTCASGQIVVAKGGSGGGFAQDAAAGGLQGLGGVAGTGDLVAVGASGMTGLYYPIAGSVNFGLGAGASSQWGGGGISGAGVSFTAGSNGGTATGYCAGGGGGFANAAVDRAGGNPSPGIVWITEYVNTP